MTTQICSLDGCTSPVVGRTLCNRHYRRAKRTGTLSAFPTKKMTYDAATLVDRLMAHVDRTAGCWLWHGTVEANGYGILKHQGTWLKAHRVAYGVLTGPIPTGLVLDHLCRNRRCVNPDHLQPVTASVNTLRGVGAPAVNARRTRCKHGHEFTPENTYIWTSSIGRPTRKCRTCHRELSRKRRARRSIA